MELVCVTFDCSDDWNVHMKLFDYGFRSYQMKNVISEQIIKTKKDYLYTPYIDQDIYLPLTDNENTLIKIYLYNQCDRDDEMIGKLVIYVNNQEIYSKDVIRYL